MPTQPLPDFLKDLPPKDVHIYMTAKYLHTLTRLEARGAPRDRTLDATLSVLRTLVNRYTLDLLLPLLDLARAEDPKPNNLTALIFADAGIHLCDESSRHGSHSALLLRELLRDFGPAQDAQEAPQPPTTES